MFGVSCLVWNAVFGLGEFCAMAPPEKVLVFRRYETFGGGVLGAWVGHRNGSLIPGWQREIPCFKLCARA